MNKNIFLILSLFLIIFAILLSKYYSLKDKYREIATFNIKYEKYNNRQIMGIDLATIINQAINDNEKAMVKKDEDNNYIKDNEKSIYIEVIITEFKEPQRYSMEALYNGGMNDFVKYYGQIPFECTKIEYNSKKMIKYMAFQQIN